METKTTAKKTARALSPNPQSQPWLALIHTTKVTPMMAPAVRLKRNQLKKLEILEASLGLLESNWSAPNAGRAAFTPPVPNAIR
ncbi:hypothetical protein LINGRAHAP2_LOCUS10227 [Linum grandiflorum]